MLDQDYSDSQTRNQNHYIYLLVESGQPTDLSPSAGIPAKKKKLESTLNLSSTTILLSTKLFGFS